MMLRYWDVLDGTIEQHLDLIPSNLKPIFQEILEDIYARKENLEDHNTKKLENRYLFQNGK